MKVRTVVATLMATAIVSAGFTVAASPASAEAPPDSCTLFSVCGYVNTQYRTDQGYELIPERDPGTCVVVAHRNAWSGMFNNSGRTVRMFRNTSCSGTDYKTFVNGYGVHQFSVRFGPTWDNSVDAIQFR